MSFQISVYIFSISNLKVCKAYFNFEFCIVVISDISCLSMIGSSLNSSNQLLSQGLFPSEIKVIVNSTVNAVNLDLF